MEKGKKPGSLRVVKGRDFRPPSHRDVFFPFVGGRESTYSCYPTFQCQKKKALEKSASEE